MIIIALAAELIFAGLLQITKNTPAYADASSTVMEEIAYYEDFTEATHIVEYVEGQRVSTDVIVLKNLTRAICLSYEIFGNNQQPDFTFEVGHDVTLNGTHSAENDNVAYFYTRYLKGDNGILVNTNGDLFEIYKRAFDDNATMFSFNKENSEIPVLNTQVAYYLFHYLYVDESDAIGQTGATYYQTYYNAYSNMLEEAENLILQSEPYYSTHYRSYKEAYCAQARYTNIALLVSIILSCLIVLLIPKYLFKDGKTVGYKVMGLGVIRTDGNPIKWYVPLIKTVIACVGFIPLAFILYMFPPFNGGYEAMFVPANPDSRVSLAWIVLIIGILGGIVNAAGLFTNKRQNLLNLLFDEVVVDVNRPDDNDDRHQTNHGRDY